ncbi:uncharacterized protein EKO05_0011140 [Ascochyta rabiei]|uniref:uncharacterized protein n=1 Tax=Didymella rabiei TaxID=5454 RepID=UPI0022074909|nr:uncharacterized protein EKO05_0011140 [Ascochyta rabiei]UPX20930.1 hypothetical protein EKO05_0011140 [Ascochyta rabiei]
MKHRYPEQINDPPSLLRGQLRVAVVEAVPYWQTPPARVVEVARTSEVLRYIGRDWDWSCIIGSSKTGYEGEA